MGQWCTEQPKRKKRGMRVKMVERKELNETAKPRVRLRNFGRD